MMPLRATAHLLRTTAIVAAISTSLMPTPSVAQGFDAATNRAIEKSMAENHQFLMALEAKMISAPARTADLAQAAIGERPYLAQEIRALVGYVDRNFPSSDGGAYKPLYALYKPHVPPNGMAVALQNGSLLYAVGAMALLGAYVASKAPDPDAGKRGTDDLPNGDDQGAPRRERNGSAPGKSTYAAERKNSDGARRVGAAALYDLGYTGKGIMVATVDSGADSRHHEIYHSLNEDLSYNFLENNHDIDDYNDHGTHVLCLIVCARDGYGVHGVAPEASSVSFNPVTPSDEQGKEYSLGVNYIARSFELSRDAQADVINNSWGTGDNIENWDLASFRRLSVSGRFERVVQDLMDADTVLVFAAGNDAYDSPDLFAGLPVLLPEFLGHWVVAASVNDNNKISSFSNRCGVAKDFCLVAPGEFLLAAKSLDGMPDNADEYIYMSGTSMAAPLVTGGVALLKQAFPELTAPEVLDILFESATDLGAKGVDEVYGHGLMNLEAAVLPIGPLSLASDESTAGPRYRLDDSRLALGGGIGGAVVAALDGHSLMAMDARNRGYSLPSEHLVSSEEGSIALGGLSAPAFDQRHFQAAGVGEMAELAVAGASGVDLTFGVGHGAHGAVAAFAGVEHSFGGAQVSAEVGRVLEAGSVLGAASSGAFASGTDASVTDTLRLGAAWGQGDTSLQFASSLGWTDFTQGAIEVRGDGILTSALAAGVARRSVWAKGDEFTISLSTPLTVSSGIIEMTAPVARVAAEGETVSTGVEQRTTRLSLEAQEQPLDLGVSYARPVGPARLKMDAGWRTSNDAAAASLGLYMEF